MNKGRIAKRGDIAALQSRIGYQFTNPELLSAALNMGRISASEGRGYDRLEKHGDRLLYPIVLSMIEARYPDAPLCELSRMERVLTTNLTLAHLAIRLDLMAVLLTRYPGFVFVEKTLADIFEAICAAIAKDAGEGDYLLGIMRLRAICQRLFAVDLALAQIDQPVPMLNSETTRRWGSAVNHEWKTQLYQGQPIGYTCKLNFKKRAAQAFGFSTNKCYVIGTGITTEQSYRKAAGLALIKLLPRRFPNDLPELWNFSWRIKAHR